MVSINLYILYIIDNNSYQLTDKQFLLLHQRKNISNKQKNHLQISPFIVGHTTLALHNPTDETINNRRRKINAQKTENLLIIGIVFSFYQLHGIVYIYMATCVNPAAKLTK